MRGSRNTQAQATVMGVSPMATVTGGPSHQVEEYWTAAVKGTSLLKFGRRGNPHMHFFRLSEDNCALQWESRNGRVRRVPLSSVHKVVQGQQTDVFIKSRSRQTRSMADLPSRFYTDTGVRNGRWIWCAKILKNLICGAMA